MTGQGHVVSTLSVLTSGCRNAYVTVVPGPASLAPENIVRQFIELLSAAEYMSLT